MLDYLGDCFKISYITDFVHKFIVILSKFLSIFKPSYKILKIFC